MKVLFRTDKVHTISSNMPDGRPCPGEAWFELVQHEGAPDPTTWEGGGNTIAYWREQFARLKQPTPWTVQAYGMEGVAPAVIPEDVVRELPGDARISLMWTFVSDAARERARAVSDGTA